MADQAAAALDRLSQRDDFVDPDELVFCNALGRRLDGSAFGDASNVRATPPACDPCAGMIFATRSARCSSPPAST